MMARPKRDPEPSPKAEALKAVRDVRAQLDAHNAHAIALIGSLDRKLMLATLDHAAEQISAIQELKRARRVKEATT